MSEPRKKMKSEKNEISKKWNLKKMKSHKKKCNLKKKWNIKKMKSQKKWNQKISEHSQCQCHIMSESS